MNLASLENIATLLPISAFLLLVLLQFVWPRRDLFKQGLRRIWHNLFLFVINSVLMRLFIPLTLITVAFWAQSQQIGLFHLLSLPIWLSTLAAVVLLDFAIYWQHVATHKIPLLWRIHKVHHADPEMDVTTAIRFHPIELLLSLAYKSLVVLLLGASASAVILFELLLFIGPAFNHSNLRLHPKIDALLRYVIATPDVHRAHHSIYKEEQDTNYGFFLIWWDKLFHTYTPEPRDGHKEMKIGLPSQQDQCNRLDEMLLAPFK